MQPTLKEEIEREEKELIDKVHKLNVHYKNLSHKEKLSLINSKKTANRSSMFVSTFDSSLLNSEEEFILQNIDIEEKQIKCLLIGDKQVGKTLFRNKLIELSEKEPKPTTMLDIKKRHFLTNNTAVKIEVWDTNITIQNSPLISSK